MKNKIKINIEPIVTSERGLAAVVDSSRGANEDKRFTFLFWSWEVEVLVCAKEPDEDDL